MSARKIADLGQEISRLTRSIEQGLAQQSLESPTIHDAKPGDLTQVNPQAAFQLVEACRELQVLAQGPRQTLGFMGLQAGILHKRYKRKT